MRILIAGTGAVGAFFGAQLARAGHDVVFLARGPNLETLARTGLTVESIDGDFHLARITAVDGVADVDPFALVLVTVKSYDTRTVAELIAPAVGPDTVVLSLQNGVENESLLASVLDLPPLLGAMTQIGAELVAPGVVRHVAEGTIFFGEPTGHETPRARTLGTLFTAAGVRHQMSLHIPILLWDKLAWNAAHNAVTALTRTSAGAAAGIPATADVLRAAMHEVVAVARAQGILLDPARVETTVAYSRARLGALRTSMLQDLERGRPLEHDAINGAVIRFGEAVGVPTPVNRALYGLLAALDLGATDPREVTMDLRFFLTVFTTVFLAELGDKTQLATFLYAADAERSKVVVFLGAASALIVTSALGVAMGGLIAQWVNPRTLSWLAGAGFIAIGLWTIARA